MRTSLFSRKKMVRGMRKRVIVYAFLLPALILYTVFVVKPMIETLYLSLHKWDGASPNMVFVGIANFLKGFGDSMFWLSVYHNVIWTFVTLIFSFCLGLMLAVLLMEKIKLKTFFNVVYFVPVIPSLVVVGIVWGWLYNPRIGLIPKFLDVIKLGWLGRGILGNPTLVLPAIAVAFSWSFFGYCMAIFIAGLHGINPVLFDAAKMDGANRWQRVWYVTIPALRNTVTLVLLLCLIFSFKVFDLVYIMTRGGPMHASEVLATYMYSQAFRQNYVGFGAALAFVLMAIIFIFSFSTISLREK